MSGDKEISKYFIRNCFHIQLAELLRVMFICV